MRPIDSRTRIALSSVGLISWLAGGTASFLNTNGAGAATLIVTSAFACVLGLMGRWPSRISMSGSGVSWEDVEKAVDSQILAAEDYGSGDLEELRNLRDRLAVLHQTGTVPDHPARAYDLDVMAALHRLLPDAEIIPYRQGNRTLPDFTVRHNGEEFFVETKWRADPTRPMRGSTLPQLIQGLRRDAKLLVLANTSVPPAPSAYQIVEESLGNRGQVVAWLNPGDDGALGAAIASLLADNGHVSRRSPKEAAGRDE